MVAARDEKGKPFAEDVILGNLVTMLVAGEDPTGYTLAWAVHHLCDEPDVVSALTREIAAVMGNDAVPDTFETANRLVYAAAVANETMRLRPVAPVIILEANEDTFLIGREDGRARPAPSSCRASTRRVARLQSPFR